MFLSSIPLSKFEYKTLKKQVFIRELQACDLPQIKSIIDENQMFPSELLDEMTQGYFDGNEEDLWYAVESEQGAVIGVAYCAPERMTEGTWNLLLIAIAKQYQGKGIGGKLMQFVEAALTQRKVRVLLVETSGLPEYQLTRAFYPMFGYKQVAVIPEYYDQGDDKVVFWKSLSSQ